MINEMYRLAVNAQLTLSAIEVTTLILILSICLLFRFNKTGLMVSYIFVYRWGWIFFIGHDEKYLFAYLLLGAIVGIITVIGLIKHPS